MPYRPGRPITARQYRQMERACRALAAKALHPEERRHLLNLASIYATSAAKLEKDPKPASRN
jgi:hypothetical protein